MPSYLGSFADWSQFQAGEVGTLKAEIQAFFIDAAIISFTDNIPIWLSLLWPATAATLQ